MHGLTDIYMCSSSKSSLNGAIELLCRVARHGEESGFGMPCLLIAAKNDVNSIPISNQDRAAKVVDDVCLPVIMHI